MYDADAIEAINFEQLVTVTDRLLLRAGRAPTRRSSTRSISPRWLAEAAEQTVIIARPRCEDRRNAINATTVALTTAILVVAMLIAAMA